MRRNYTSLKPTKVSCVLGNHCAFTRVGGVLPPMESLKKRSERASTKRTYEGHIRRPGHGQCDTTNHDPQKRVTVISNFLSNAFSVYLCRRCPRCLIPSRESTYIPTNDGPIGNSLPCYACSCSVMLASTHRRGFPV